MIRSNNDKVQSHIILEPIILRSVALSPFPQWEPGGNFEPEQGKETHSTSLFPSVHRFPARKEVR